MPGAPETAEPALPLPTTLIEIREGNRAGPDGKRGERRIWGEFPTTGVPWVRRWRVEAAPGTEVFLYAGQELIHTSSARGAENGATAPKTTHHAGDLAGPSAEARAEAKALEGQLVVLRQQVTATEEASARATRELAETRAQLEVERRRVELEMQSLRDHLHAERENARASVREAFEQASRERAQHQEAARLERERLSAERTELTAERTAQRTAFREELERMRAAHQAELDKLAGSYQQQRDQMADQLEKDRQRHQQERDRLQRDIEKAAQDAKTTMAASLESMNLAAESVSTIGGRVRKLVNNVLEGDEAVVIESLNRKVAAAQAIRETTEEVKKNMAEQAAPGPSAWDEFIKAGAKVLGRIDPHKVMKLSPKLKKILEEEGDDD